MLDRPCRAGVALVAIAAALAGCVRPVAQRPPACCAAIGYTRAQVESVLGRPSPPQGSRWHPFPSPPPDSPIYTTEHGYVTVTYARATHLATRFSTDFYEGKAPSEAFRIASAFLPSDAVDTKGSASGPHAAIRVFKSDTVAKRWPAGAGIIYVECLGPQPALLCYKEDVVVPNAP